MATLIYQTTEKGYMIFRGNSLCIKNGSASRIAQADAFISLDPTKSAGAGFPSSTSTTIPGSPFGSTLNWMENGSFSEVPIPSTSTVLFAGLVWATQSPPVSVDTPITFSTPTTTTLINPNPSYSFSGSGFFTRGADVTNLVQSGGSGIYSVSSVPNVIPTNGAGWVICVIFKDNTASIKNMSFFVGSDFNPVNTTVSGFLAPSVGPVNARALVAAQFGDTFLSPDSFVINGTSLSGPKNPVNNFFCSQFVDENGDYYNGSMNSFNAIPGATGADSVITPYCRYDFDITNVNATGTITPNSTSANIVIPAIGEAIILDALGLELNALLATINPIKFVDKGFAGGGSTLTYTISFTNSGNITASNIFFSDTIPANTTFIPNSVVVNGTTIPSISPNPPSSVPISDLASNGTSTITFQVLINTTIPIPSTINNLGVLNYNTFGATTPLSSITNIVATTINAQATITLPKSALPSAVKRGETITYTIGLTNTGNATANNVFFSDTLPPGTILAPGSINPSPPSSVSIGSISPNSTVTVTFRVIVTSLPTSGTIPNTGSVNFTFTQDPSVPNGAGGSANSNTVITHVNEAILSSTKFVSRTSASLGDTLTYTIVISNTGNATANNVVFIDTIPIGTTFISGSLKQNGTTIPSSPNPPGTALSSIAPGGVSSITFDVLAFTIPLVNPILNDSTTNFNYIFDPSTLPNVLRNGNTNSNVVSTLFGFATLNNSIKSVDKQYAKCGDTITYTIVIPNSGNVTANNVFLVDTIPDSTDFVPDSVIINGISYPGYNPSIGITIPDIAPSTNSTVTFKVVIQC